MEGSAVMWTLDHLSYGRKHDVDDATPAHRECKPAGGKLTVVLADDE
jgi:hypothetical protein